MPKNTSFILGDHFDAFVASLIETGRYANATDAIRAAKLGREILKTLGNKGADWVKLEVLGDSKTLLLLLKRREFCFVLNKLSDNVGVSEERLIQL